ncbi:hypothetical protein GCM10009850_092740 [Nonomuraea monospora]|uniref:Uncharacterized protein n=1 Tax=Nonomuraea monospora TaxID=568818 RepID=A0ABN3CWE0_9ACTN
MSIALMVPLKNTIAWQIIGKALNLTATQPAHMLAELTALGATERRSPGERVRDALQSDDEKRAFDQALQEYPDTAPPPVTPNKSPQPPPGPPPLTITKRQQIEKFAAITVDDVKLPKAAITLPGNVATFDDLINAVKQNPTVLKQALDDPLSPNRQHVEQWVAQIAKVVPDLPLTLRERIPLTDEVMWRIAGKALHLMETHPAHILAELTATKEGTIPGVAAQIEKSLTPAEGPEFTARLAFYRVSGLPLQAPPQLSKLPPPSAAPAKEAAQRKDGSQRATALLAELRQHWLTTIRNSKQAKAQRTDPGYAEQRAHDRLGWVLSMIGKDRKCVSVLRRGRSIGVFANKPDAQMAQDLEMLLSAARAEGQEARQRRTLILAKWVQAQQTMTYPPSKVALERFDARLRKAIAYLRDLERTEGRMGAVAYAEPIRNNQGQPVEVHAEMQAFLLSKTHSGGKLGISKQCCFKCWLVLTSCAAGIIDRKDYVSHGKVLYWPMLEALTTDDILTKVFTTLASNPLGSPAAKQAFIQTLTQQKGDAQKYQTTEYLTPLSQAPATPADEPQADILLQDLTTDEQDEEAFSAMLDGDESNESHEALGDHPELITLLRNSDPHQQDPYTQDWITTLSG